MYTTSTQYFKNGNIELMPYRPYMFDNNTNNILAGFTFIEQSEQPIIPSKKYYVGCVKPNDTIIIRRIGGMGDVIWTLPVAKYLKEKYNCTIKYCTFEKDWDIFKNLSYVDEVLKKPYISVEDALATNWILDYWYSIEGNSVAGFEDSYDISWEWAFGKDANKDYVKECLQLTQQEESFAKEIFKNPTIIVALQSSAVKRSYPYAQAIINGIKDKGYDIAIVGNIPQKDQDGVINMTGKTNIRELFALIKESKMVICVDSGNLHIASQFNVPTICLFTTVKAYTRTKYYPNVTAIETDIACSPCLQINEYCPKEPECMSRIMPDTILKAVDKIIGDIK